jgi:hypothetical protein
MSQQYQRRADAIAVRDLIRASGQQADVCIFHHAGIYTVVVDKRRRMGA